MCFTCLLIYPLFYKLKGPISRWLLKSYEDRDCIIRKEKINILGFVFNIKNKYFFGQNIMRGWLILIHWFVFYQLNRKYFKK